MLGRKHVEAKLVRAVQFGGGFAGLTSDLLACSDFFSNLFHSSLLVIYCVA